MVSGNGNAQAHDIGESLQNKIEQMEEIERAFVHLDFECDHHPEHNTSPAPKGNLLVLNNSAVGFQATLSEELIEDQ